MDNSLMVVGDRYGLVGRMGSRNGICLVFCGDPSPPGLSMPEYRVGYSIFQLF